MNAVVCWFVKLTGWLPFHLLARPKYYYEDEAVQGRKISSKAIVMGNHQSIWDFAMMMFCFIFRNLRCIVAETMFEKNKFLTWTLKRLGAIRVDRHSSDFAFISKACEVLQDGGVVEIYPESRLPLHDEKSPLPFKESVVYLALKSGAPIVPLVNDGHYFRQSKLHVLIGKPINVHEMLDERLDERENVRRITQKLQEKTKELLGELETHVKQDKKPNLFLYDFVRFTGLIPALIWLKPKIIHQGICKLRRVKGMLICSNHRSFMDPVMLLFALWYRRLRFLATKELFSSPLKSFFFDNMQCIKVDRENFNMDSFHMVVDKLQAGKAVCIFPEGKICNTADYSFSFEKTSAVIMAHKAGVPILPVYLRPAQKWYQRSIAVVGDPINIRDICGSIPSMKMVNYANELIVQKEKELKQRCDEECAKRGRARDVMHASPLVEEEGATIELLHGKEQKNEKGA